MVGAGQEVKTNKAVTTNQGGKKATLQSGYIVKCVLGSFKEYELRPTHCVLPDNTRITDGQRVIVAGVAVRCVTIKDVPTIRVESVELTSCTIDGQTRQNGEQTITEKTREVLVCRDGRVIKLGCMKDGKLIPASESAKIGTVTYDCPPSIGEAACPGTRITGCKLPDGREIYFEKPFRYPQGDKTKVYECNYMGKTRNEEHIKITQVACKYGQDDIPLDDTVVLRDAVSSREEIVRCEARPSAGKDAFGGTVFEPRVLSRAEAEQWRQSLLAPDTSERESVHGSGKGDTPRPKPVKITHKPATKQTSTKKTTTPKDTATPTPRPTEPINAEIQPETKKPKATKKPTTPRATDAPPPAQPLASTTLGFPLPRGDDTTPTAYTGLPVIGRDNIQPRPGLGMLGEELTMRTTKKPKVPSVEPFPPASECGTKVIFPTSDRCYKKFNTTSTVCASTGGEMKMVSGHYARFTGTECGCDVNSRGDGYYCHRECSIEQKRENKCKTKDEMCAIGPDGKPYCACVYSKQRDANGVCAPITDQCDQCKHNCHVSAKCRNVAQQYSAYTCTACDQAMGYIGSTGIDCQDIDECARSNNCDSKAVCENMEPLVDDGYKYKCACRLGWRGDKEAGTTCRPCKDNDECSEKPAVCGDNAKCINTPGSYMCECLPGFTKNSKGECVDVNECSTNQHKCHSKAECSNTVGSYTCQCGFGYKGDGRSCELDEEVGCRDCHTNSTICEMNSQQTAFVCNCKQYYERVTNLYCKPKTYCDKWETTTCAPRDRAICIENEDHSGYSCDCKEGFTGNGHQCEYIDICLRKTPCMKVQNTVCKPDEANPSEKYSCPCRIDHVRQVADFDRNDVPCIHKDNTPVNNCTLCSVRETCEVVKSEKNVGGALKECVCKPGYSRTHGECRNINECVDSALNDCDTSRAVCNDYTPDLHDGKMYECKCIHGYTGTGKKGTCKDINECDDPLSCPNNRTDCVNTVGSYECKCKSGFDMMHGTCVDVNECLQGTATCNVFSSCNNTEGGYECFCDRGYKEVSRDASGKPICEDINECQLGTHKCSANSKCVNEPRGSYTCVCNEGFKKDNAHHCIDINECKTKTAMCDLTTTDCFNTEPGYKCVCKHGYQPTEAGTYCVDVNECEVGNHTCDPLSSFCENLVPSYRCVCNTGFLPAPNSNPLRPSCQREKQCEKNPHVCGPGQCIETNTDPFYKCVCPSSCINYNDTACIGQKYCDGLQFLCPGNSECVNNMCHCLNGFNWIDVELPITLEKIDARKSCKEDDPCSRNPCKPPMSCDHTGPGAYVCNCPQGYYKEMEQCFDIDECRNTTCPPHSKCFNGKGFYTCECESGFENTNCNKDANTNPVCENIDECKVKLDNCSRIENSICKDLPGSFYCDCEDGYRSNVSCIPGKCAAQGCADVDECLLNSCPENSICYNYPGTFECKCKPGFVKRNHKCIDKDECDLGTHNCDEDTQDCINLPGTFNCTCKPGYEFLSGKCEDINECLKGACLDKQMKCNNTIGSFHCICDDGYDMVDGTCKDRNECNFPDACPQGIPNVCKNKPGTHECTCLSGYRKKMSCANKPFTCPCEDIPECEEGVQKDGETVETCGKNTECIEKEGGYDCKCKKNYIGNPFVECKKQDICDREPCENDNEVCVPSDDKKSRSCECRSGHLRIGKTCIQNPCAKNPCDITAQCTIDEKDKTHKCVCPHGYIFNDNGECIPEDVCQCKGKEAPCVSSVCKGRNTMCHPKGAKTECKCTHSGFVWDKKKEHCIDRDECVLDKPCPPTANCTNLEDGLGYYCDCIRGQYYDRYLKECVPDSDCLRMEFGCKFDSNTECKNVSPTQVHCMCKQHYTGDARPQGEECKPINYCEKNNVKCGENEVPVATGTECVCSCKVGFKNVDDKCVDIDECVNSPCCPISEKCVNTPGSYKCECKAPKYEWNDKANNCTKVNKCLDNHCNKETEICIEHTGECVCQSGYAKPEDKTKPCGNINECAINQYSCPAHSHCVDDTPGYHCECNHMYSPVMKDEKLVECKPTDICKEKLDNCDRTAAKCVSLFPGYKCVCQTDYVQLTQYVCGKNSTYCTACGKNAHCIMETKTNSTAAGTCKCNQGFRGNPETGCEDIDECKEGTHNCHAMANCTNLIPGFLCTCNEPYRGDGRTCNKIDVCGEAKYNDCPTVSTCEPLDKAVDSENEMRWVTCKCHEGFQFNTQSRKCDNIDECKACKDYNNCPCPKDAVKCIDKEPGFTCECAPGFVYNPRTNTCDDINECEIGTFVDTCTQTYERCVNEIGSWHCECERGYVNPADNNKTCHRDLFCTGDHVRHNCNLTTSDCREKLGDFECDCKKGFQKHPDHPNICEDVNECLNNNVCADVVEYCVNTFGDHACNCSNGYERIGDHCEPSKQCDKNCGAYGICLTNKNKQEYCGCQTGYYRAADEDACVVVPCEDRNCPMYSKCRLVQTHNETAAERARVPYKCVCDDGFTMKNGQCVKVDICKEKGNTAVCGLHGICERTDAAPFFKCKCIEGADLSKGDMCEMRTCEADTCDVNADCKKRPQDGGMYCKCRPGYKGIGSKLSPCTKISICDTSRPCSKFATCEDMDGEDYKCTCNTGYVGNGTWCKDENECLTKKHNCDIKADCLNIEGSFNCICHPGYTGKGTVGDCHDINECHDPTLNQCDACTTSCINTVGSYVCLCNDGYERIEGNSNYTCTNINECLNTTICGIHECVDTEGSYRCNCKQPFWEQVPGSEILCKDVNECDLVPKVCHELAICENREEGYDCDCIEGYTGDGKTKCEVIDKCVNSTFNSCDVKTTVCKMQPDQPLYSCVCKAGFKPPVDGQFVSNCIDIDECNDEMTVYDRVTTDCRNTIGDYELFCRKGYEPVDSKAPNHELKCQNMNECAIDPAYQETFEKMEAIKYTANKDFATIMVPPKNNNSAYAYCYNRAMAADGDFNGDKLPMCIDRQPGERSVYIQEQNSKYNNKPAGVLVGWDCTCLSGNRQDLDDDFGGPFKQAFCGASMECEECHTERNYECVEGKCRCKKGFSEEYDAEKKVAVCSNRECSTSGAKIAPKGFNMTNFAYLKCDGTQWAAIPGFELVRNAITNVVEDVVDIDECTVLPEPCCSKAVEKTCTGPFCVKCVNTIGGFACRGAKDFECACDDVDRQTCMCTAPACTKTQVWYKKCQTGKCLLDAATIKAQPGYKAGPVCSRILDGTLTPKTYSSLEELLLLACGNIKGGDCAAAIPSKKELCEKTACAINQKVFNATIENLIFNHFGPCTTDIASVTCPDGSKPGTAATQTGKKYAWCKPTSDSQEPKLVQPFVSLGFEKTQELDCSEVNSFGELVATGEISARPKNNDPAIQY